MPATSLLQRLFAPVAILTVCTGLAATAQADYRSTIIGDTPIGYWRLGEAGAITSGSTLAIDEMGLHHATYYGTTVSGGGVLSSVTPGRSGAIEGDANTSVLFSTLSGSTTYTSGGAAVIQSAGDFNRTGNLPFTIEAWISFDAVANASPYGMLGIFTKGNVANGTGYAFGISRTSNVDGEGVIDSFSFASYGSGGATLNTSAISYEAGEWYHIAVTYDASKTMKIYFDGVEIGTRANMNFVTDSTGGAMIGAVYNSAITNALNPSKLYAPFPGLIDEVAFYNYALSGEQIATHIAAAAIPEPGSLILLGTVGALALGMRFGRKG